jgi:hypothetical protein
VVVDSGLVGPHAGLVQGLVDRLDRIVANDLEVPRVVVLRAESGFGKSRIVRELYGRLAAGLQGPVFWPLTIAAGTDPGGRVDPLEDRKVIGPPLDGFVWPPNALPSFGWWAFNCERLSTGASANVLAAAQAELEVWLPPLTKAWATHAGVWDKLVAKRHDLEELLREAAVGEATDAALAQLQELLNVTVPGIGTLAGWVWKAGKAGKRRFDEAQDLATSVDLGQRLAARRDDTARELANGLRTVTHPKLPGIVVVEDAHRLTADMAAFVTELARPVPDRPVLIVLTAWPEGELNPVWNAWLGDTQRAGYTEMVQVPQLDGRDLETLVRRQAPMVSERDAKVLAAAMPSPLLLELWLTLKATRRRIDRHGGALPVDPQVLAQIPRTLQQVYRQRWQELTPPGTRSAHHGCRVEPNRRSGAGVLARHHRPGGQLHDRPGRNGQRTGVGGRPGSVDDRLRTGERLPGAVAGRPGPERNQPRPGRRHRAAGSCRS